MNKLRSLKHQMLLSLSLPLVFFVVADSVLSYYVTQHYVNETYDRWLTDSAKSLIQEIRVRQDMVSVELPPVALEMFKWDEEDKIHFKIVSAEYALLAGDAIVPDPPLQVEDWSVPVVYDASLNGEPARVVSIRIELRSGAEPVFVCVAETKNKRRTMMRDFLLVDLVTQLLLVMLTGFYLLAGTRHGLQPLQVLAGQVARRSPRDLSPISDIETFIEVRTLTDTINDLLGQLRQAVETQNRFIANAAHQLRTPLAGLKIQAERVLREPGAIAYAPALLQIRDCADRLSHLTSQLLVLAKSEPIKGGSELEPVDLHGLSREICMEWAPLALQRQMELAFDGPGHPVLVAGDATLLRELLGNLLDNAIRYGFERGNVSVVLQEWPQPKLTVSDDGPGIPDSEIGRVFERFYRLGPGTGCGLGLAIVKEIADLHRARIELGRGEQGSRGTRIEVAFPALPAGAAGNAQASPECCSSK